MSTPFAYLLCVLAGCIWALSFVFLRVAADGGGHPLGLAFWQALIGAVILIVVCGARRSLPPVGRRYVWLYPLLAICGTAAPGTLYFVAASALPAGILALTIALVPILTYAVSLPFGLDSLSTGRLLGVVSGVVGVGLLVLPESSLPDASMVPWLFVAFAAVAFYCAENVIVPTFVPFGTDMLALLAAMQIVAAVLLLAIILPLDAWVSLRLPFTMVEWSIVGMGVVSAIAYSMFLVVLQHAGPVFASQVGYVSTLAGVLLGIVIFDERHSSWVWTALFFLMLGLALVTPRRRSESP